MRLRSQSGSACLCSCGAQRRSGPTAIGSIEGGGVCETESPGDLGSIPSFAEEIGASYVSSGYRDAMGFLIIILVLLFKPTGLFARAERIG